MSIGSRLTQARIDRGVTQVQLAKILRVTQATCSMLEADENEHVGQGLEERAEAWLASGKGAPAKAPKGPVGRYGHRSTTTKRATIKKRVDP